MELAHFLVLLRFLLSENGFSAPLPLDLGKAIAFLGFAVFRFVFLSNFPFLGFDTTFVDAARPSTSISSRRC